MIFLDLPLVGDLQASGSLQEVLEQHVVHKHTVHFKDHRCSSGPHTLNTLTGL